MHSTKLITLAKSLQAWKDSKYGSLFRFCDIDTFSKVVEFWKGYIVIDRIARDKISIKLKDDLKKSADTRTSIMGGNGIVLTGFRSASPVALNSMEDLPKLHTNYLKTGTTNGSQAKDLMVHSTILWTFSSDFIWRLHTLHWLLHSHSKPVPNLHKRPSRQYVLSSKLGATRSRHAPKIWLLRFFTSDALSFCRTLQQIRYSKNNKTASCYRGQNSSSPLLLDSEDYTTGGDSPLIFTAIDTSNLVDHLGPLNVLMAASPLLESKMYATLCTEVLVHQENTPIDTINSLLWGDFPSMSILLGLIPVEYFTKTTVVSCTEETILNAVTNGESGKIRC